MLLVVFVATCTDPEKEIKAFIGAVGANQLSVVKAKIDSGLNVNAYPTDDGPAIIAAAVGGHLEIAKLLFENKADANLQGDCKWPALFYVKPGDTAMARLLIENRANVNAKDASGYTPLMYAAAKNDTALARVLIENGADIEAKNSSDQTALLLAIALKKPNTDNTAMIELLSKK